MRRPFTSRDAYARGISPSALKWLVRSNRIQRVIRGVYVDGSEPPTRDEVALAHVVATGGVASGPLAGLLYELDSIQMSMPFVTVDAHRSGARPEVRCLDLSPLSVVDVKGYRCTDGLQTMLDLATSLCDLEWEQALESALRKKLLTVDTLSVELKRQGESRVPGTRRIRRVLELRPDGAPPTESVLETMMVQLIRTTPGLPEPARQVEVRNRHGDFIARVDLAWPTLGVFLELDGQQHKDQPVYDANRETRVVATTGWLPGRFTWTEVTRVPNTTARRLLELLHTSSQRRF